MIGRLYTWLLTLVVCVGSSAAVALFIPPVSIVSSGTPPTEVTSVNNTANIGNMLVGGGLASSFDGTTTGKTCSGGGTASSRTADVNAYVGRAYSGGGHQVTKAELYSHSGGFANSGGTVTLTLRGHSSDTGPGGGTSLGSVSVPFNTTAMQTITSNDITTFFTHIWIQNNGATAGGSICFAQLKFFGF